MAGLTEVLKTRIDAELREALERQAAKEDRDVSQLVRRILREKMELEGQVEAVILRD
jgi:predicted HicB family RNase H-like nuclease